MLFAHLISDFEKIAFYFKADFDLLLHEMPAMSIYYWVAS